jgi:hypothetical protein
VHTIPYNPQLLIPRRILGWHSAYFTPSDFVSRQLPTTTTTALTPVPKTAEILALSLANVYLLLGGIAILCTAITREARVVKGYLFIIALGDLGHIYASYQVMGPSMFWDFANYNDLVSEIGVMRIEGEKSANMCVDVGQYWFQCVLACQSGCDDFGIVW